MPRAIWSGSLGFGLVQIPVSVHGVEEANELSFTLLDKNDFSPVGYERINKKTGKEVKGEDTVKGYEAAPGKYVVVTDHDFAAANPEATHQIDILDFVELSTISPYFFDKPYVIVPDKKGVKPYALLREVMKRSNKAGIAKVVLRTRQHLCAVVADGKALSLLVLRFADELKGTSGLNLPDQSLKKLGITNKELEMADKLVAGMVGEWQPDKYRDDYRQDLLAAIHERAKAGDVNAVSEVTRKPAAKKTAKVVDLVALLKESVAGKGVRGRSTAAHTESAKPPAKKAKASPKGSRERVASAGHAAHRKSA